MNRKKKLNEIHTKRVKKANSKLHSTSKPRYISKEERAKIESQVAENSEAENSAEESSAEEGM
ncbi:DUF2986 domain-containing protein [Neptunomonas antarctica]|uniref:DUF2986 domain-containing protein n=1 Tax=Neptunomonas antarctica TaxID=619304 RepID=A0A1N7KBZ3_9GAMM|nr:DUF2986 domain-containing protein [Neptunomonas antarctica]SIS59073.1 Protein of unknown function [Neptunomonas antarctica]